MRAAFLGGGSVDHVTGCEDERGDRCGPPRTPLNGSIVGQTWMTRYLTVASPSAANPLRGRPTTLPDQYSGEGVALAEIWEGLVAAKLSVVDHASTPDAFRLVVQRSEGRSLMTRPEDAGLLQFVLTGGDVDGLAAQRGVRAPTIIHAARECLRAFGVKGPDERSVRRGFPMRRCPALLTIAAHAAQGGTALSRGIRQAIREGVTEVRFHRFDEALIASEWPLFSATAALDPLANPRAVRGRTGDTFPERDRDLLRMIVDGLSVEEIAYSTSMATRTTRLVIARLFSNLGVRTRSQLLSELIRHAR